MKGEEEEKKPRREIGFLEGTNFLGAIDKKLNREEKKRRTQQKTRLKKEGKKMQCMSMLRAKQIASWTKTQSKLLH